MKEEKELNQFIGYSLFLKFWIILLAQKYALKGDSEDSNISWRKISGHSDQNVQFYSNKKYKQINR
jgi:hypothetical protein